MLLHPSISEISIRRDQLLDAVQKGHLAPEISRYVQPGWAYVLKEKGTPALAYPSIGNFNAVDEDAGSIAYVVTTDIEDRDGDIVRPMGAHLQNYSLSPVVFFGHQEKPIPIGVCRSPDGRITVFPEENRMIDVIYYDREDPDADFIYQKCRRKILNATSIAFVPIEAWRRNDVRKAHGQNQQEQPGWYFNQWDKTEVSIVGVPSNPKAVGLAKDLMGACRDVFDRERSFMSPNLQKAWQPYVAQAKGCFAGWCPLPGDEKDLGGGIVLKAVEKSCSCDDCSQGKTCGCGRQQKSRHPFEVRQQGEDWFVYDGGQKVSDALDSREEAEKYASGSWREQSEGADQAEKQVEKFEHRYAGRTIRTERVSSGWHWFVDGVGRSDYAYDTEDEAVEAAKNALEGKHKTKAMRRAEFQSLWQRAENLTEQELDRVASELSRTSREDIEELAGIAGVSGGWEQVYDALERRSKVKTVKEQPSEDVDPDKACILPGQELQGRVSASSKAWYAGQALRIRTAKGTNLSVTPNHPILTEVGFISASKLKEGDNLLRYVGEDETTLTDDNVQYAPILVEQVFEAFADSPSGFGVESHPITVVDFHGDAMGFQSDVEVVRADGMLADRFIAETSEGFVECGFRGEGEYEPLLSSCSGSDEVGGVLFSSSPSAVSRSGEGLSLLDGGVLHSQPLSVGHIPENSSFLQFPVKNGMAQSGISDECGRTFSSKISLDDVLKSVPRNDNFLTSMDGAVHFGPGAELDVPRSKPLSDRPGADAGLSGKLCNRFSSKVVLDQVVAVDCFHYEGSVYDFQSPLGYILTEKLVVSNCQILRDGEVDGQPLTEAQRGMFGAACAKAQKSYGGLRETCKALVKKGETSTIPQTVSAFYWNVFDRSGGDWREALRETKEKFGLLDMRVDVAGRKIMTITKQATQADLDSPGVPGRNANPDGDAKQAEEERSKAPAKRAKPAKKAALSQSDGRVGGYTVPPGGVQSDKKQEPLDDAQPPGWTTCESCHGDSNCTACGGIGEGCDECGGSGECPECAGQGHMEKQRKSPRRKQNSAGHTPAQIAPQNTEEEPMKQELDEEKPSLSTPQVLAALYSHAKAEAAYLDQLDDQYKDTLADYRRQQVEERMDMLKYQFSRAAGEDDDIEKLCKAFEDEHDKGMETDGPDSVVEPGEAGMVEAGEIPPEEESEPLTEKQRRKRARTMKQNTVPAEGAYTEDDPEAAAELDSGSAPFNKAAPGTEEWAEEEMQEPEHQKAGDPGDNVDEGPTVYNKEDDEAEEKQGGSICMCGMEVPEGATECPGCGAPVKKADPPLEESPLEEAEPPVEMELDEDAVPKDSDPGTEEIIERYRQPKSNKWATRKHRVKKSLLPFLKHRVAANGKKYLVRAKQTETEDETKRRKESEALDDSEVKALTTKLAGAIDDLKSLVKAREVPKHLKPALKHIAETVWYVGKALTDKGKVQANGGGGSELTDAGKVQANGGKGGELKDKGEQQGKSPTKSHKHVRQVSPAVQRKFEETLAKLKRFGVLNGSV